MSVDFGVAPASGGDLMPAGALPRLQEALAHAYAHTRLARRKLDAAGLRPEDVRRPGDLHPVVPTTRDEYRRAFPAEVLVAGSTLGDPLVVRSRSSGTAHERLSSADWSFTLAERRFGALAVNEPLLAVLSDPGTRRSVRYAAPNCSDVECSLPTTTFEDRVLPNGMLVLPSAHDLYATPDSMLRKAWDEIGTWRPDYLSCDPVRFGHLLRHAEARGPAPILGRALIMTYNFDPAFAVAHLAARLPADTVLANSVTMSECGWVAASCPEGTLHLNTEALWLELLDAELRPAAVGDLGELVVTTLGRPLAPRLRYRTGDLYRRLAGCPCRHAHPAVRFEGRWRDAPRCADGSRLTTREVDDLVGAPDHLVSYRFHQQSPELAELRYISDRGPVPRWSDDLREWLVARLGARCRVEIEAVASLPSQRSGKFLTCTTAVS